MATIIGSINRLVNQTSTQVIDHEIPRKMAEVVTSFVSSGFQVVEDVIKIARDVTVEPETEEGES